MQILPTICATMYSCMIEDGRDKNTNSQTSGSIKYISNTNGGVMQNKIYCNYNKYVF
jgi:hypothetical protein